MVVSPARVNDHDDNNDNFNNDQDHDDNEDNNNRLSFNKNRKLKKSHQVLEP